MDFPKGVIGLIGDSGSGVSELLHKAVGAIPFDYSLDCADALTRLRAESELERHRREGATVLLASHHPALLTALADEVWWIQDGEIAFRGHPADTIRRYSRHVTENLRASIPAASLNPSLRRGDGRAEILDLTTLDGSGKPTSIWASGEQAIVRVRVRFASAVEDPVAGIMIRTRIGFEVYGTNTELENVRLGPCAPGDLRTVDFAFSCDLCPQYYTITAASHDPDGVWHDWMEDAVSITVTDGRYTAGVANLRAKVTCYRE